MRAITYWTFTTVIISLLMSCSDDEILENVEKPSKCSISSINYSNVLYEINEGRLISIDVQNSSLDTKFDYDNLGRIIQVREYGFNDVSDSADIETYVYNTSNQIIKSHYSWLPGEKKYYYKSSGELEKSVFSFPIDHVYLNFQDTAYVCVYYEYHKGNIIKKKTTTYNLIDDLQPNADSILFEYDEMLNPFYSINYINPEGTNRNNLTKMSSTSIPEYNYTIKYSYLENGLPNEFEKEFKNGRIENGRYLYSFNDCK